MKAVSTTFSGGVIGEGLYGRVDLNKYQTGLKTAHNMHIAVEGGAEKRFGTYLVGEPKYSDRYTRLIPWRVSNDDSYMLEVGDEYVRFIRFGGYVSIPGGHTPHADSDATNVGGYMEVPLPYSADEVKDLRYTFANDIMYLFHQDHEPRELRRLGLYDWQVATMNFTPHESGPSNFAGTYTDGTGSGDNYNPVPIPIEYKVSATLANGVETLASGPISVSADIGHRKNFVTLTWDAVTDAIQYTVYKGSNGIFGFIGFTETNEYKDRNFAPSYSTVPIGKMLEFPAGEYPRVGEFRKQRMVYAAPKSLPQTLYLSKPAIMNSLATSIPSLDDDAIMATLVGRERHTIQYMLELKRFVIFTDTAEWILDTIENQAMTPASLDPTKETSYGIDPDLPPLPIGDRILFIQNITGDLRDLGYVYTSDAFQADDLSRLAKHLFRNRKINSWTYAGFPSNLIHCTTNDGALRTMTYVREHEIWAWSTYATQGEYRYVASVPEINHDGVYFLVERTINGVTKVFTERTEVNFNGRIEDMVYVDAALTFKSERQFHNFTVEDHETVNFTVDAHTYSVGDFVRLEFCQYDENATEELIRDYHVEIIEIDGDDVKARWARAGTMPEGILLDEFGDEITTGRVLRCATRITGFDHLIGAKEIWVLADGKVLKNLQVDSEGGITLPFHSARVHAGLPYKAVLETLDMDAEGAQGQYTLRTVNDITLRLRKSRAVWAGARESETGRDLELITPRSAEGYYDPNSPLDGAYEIPYHPNWTLTCGVRVESRDPLPLNVLNIVPDLVYGT